MRKDITISGEPREKRGKNEARRLRVRGLSPAVVYGPGFDPVSVAVDPKAVNQILRSTSGHNTIFNVDIQGQLAPVMIVDWQNEPLKGRLLHIDLKRIDLTKRIVVKVPIHTVGDPKGVKLQGGLHELITREVEIECLPDDIPEQFTVEVGELMIGQSIRAADIPLAGSMKLVSPPEAVISHVIALRATEAVAEPEVVAAVAEPEVIKKGKKEEDEVKKEGKKEEKKDEKKKR